LDKQFFKKEKKENWLINHIGLLILILAFIGGFTAFIVAKTYTSNFLGDFSQHQDKCIPLYTSPSFRQGLPESRLQGRIGLAIPGPGYPLTGGYDGICV